MAKEAPERPKQRGPRKRKRKEKPQTTQTAPDMIGINSSQLSDDIPAEVKVAFADAVMAYSAMEATVERLIWEITGLTYDDGRLLTRIDMSVKLDLLKTLIENYGLLVHYDRKTTMDMWIAAKQLMPVRNLVAHGIWAMLDHKIPVVVSYRLPTTTGNVVGEACRIERLEAMTRQSYRIKKSLDGLSERVRASPPKRPAPHRAT